MGRLLLEFVVSCGCCALSSARFADEFCAKFLLADYIVKVVTECGVVGDGSSIEQTSMPESPSFLGIIELDATWFPWKREE